MDTTITSITDNNTISVKSNNFVSNDEATNNTISFDTQSNYEIQKENEEKVNPYETIIAQQQAQIDALIKQSNSLTQQITNLVQNGAQLNAQPAQTKELEPQSAFNPKSLAETDSFLSMEDLAREMAKK